MTLTRALAACTLLVALLALPARSESDGLDPVPQVPIPPQPWGAVGGAAFIAQIENLSFTAREARIYQELASGNVPPFTRTFVAVKVSAVIGGTTHNGTFYVMPEYLSVGRNKDFARMPMSPQVAQPLLDLYGCVWPTRKMVDAIWQKAPVKLAPIPLSPSTYNITAVATFYYHHQLIEQERFGYARKLLTAGTKKDVVVTPLLATNPGKVAIYGWHYTNGQHIQPLYLGHGITYVDYSHGIRPVYGDMLLDGVWTPIKDVLADPALCVLLSDEGPIASPRY